MVVVDKIRTITVTAMSAIYWLTFQALHLNFEYPPP